MRFLHAGAIYAAANIASAAVPFMLLPLLTRVLTPADYGYIVAFALLVTLCMPFAGLSVHSAVGVAWFNKSRDEIPAFNGTALGLIVVTTAIVAPIVAVVVELMPSLVAGLPPVWGAVAALTAGANVTLQCRLVLWQSQGQPLKNAILQVSASVLNVGLSLLAVLAFGWESAGRNAGIAVSLIAMATVAVVMFMLSRDATWSFRPKYLAEQVRFGMPLVPHVLAGVFLGTIDRWMVSTQLGAEALGIYGAAAQLGMVMTILADGFVKAYNPWLYAQLGSDNANGKYNVVGAVYLAVPAFVCVGAVVGLILHWTSGIFLGPRYADANTVLPWFVLGGTLSGVYFCLSSIFFFTGRTGLLASCTSSAAAVGAMIVWLLVTLLGVQGAAIGFAVTQGLLALFVAVTAINSFDLPWSEIRKAVGTLLQSAHGSTRLKLLNP
ncbi:oligosaccharide flippase family protein [Bradyrhizobium sp. 200]|uniref:lipopolysaccharide biosynthesis protein n=1 Tax=Bradyrhizobium sp. 200 TaxID=2782665 RepID=UPI001FFE8DFE|nr:oligosaccharide flippase family protein [Bradyrhizobium sp. 200]UPJ51968.1 oligosaccharide flippase family protein [Bradyrhizobium sp. 200]